MSEPYQRWVCDACGYIYDEAKGDPDSGLIPGTRYADIPDDWQCPLCGLNKSDLRLLPDAPIAPAQSRPMAKAAAGKSKGGDDHVVIVGAGIAGWSVAEAIRARDPEQPVLLVSACPGSSYPKPALSTALAKGKRAEELVEMDAASKAASLGIEIRTETRVIKLDPAKKRLTTSKGGIQYGRLVLALGAQQRDLPLQGDAAEQVLKINDLGSYGRFRKRLEQGVRHVTIMGSGLIGCEFAEDLSAAGYAVSVLDPAEYPMASLLPAKIAAELKEKLGQKGIDWHLSARMDSLEPSNGRLRAVLDNGDAIETDLVLSAAGLVANCQLAEKAGMEINRGICSDRSMKTSVEDIYAIGDCAEVEGQIFAYIEPIRRQAQAIAADLRGEYDPFIPLPPLIRVKTPSYPLCICPPAQGSGEAELASSEVDAGVWEYRSGDRKVGFICCNQGVDGATRLYREVFA